MFRSHLSNNNAITLYFDGIKTGLGQNITISSNYVLKVKPYKSFSKLKLFFGKTITKTYLDIRKEKKLGEEPKYYLDETSRYVEDL